jgi:hypothetical protein
MERNWIGNKEEGECTDWTLGDTPKIMDSMLAELNESTANNGLCTYDFPTSGDSDDMSYSKRNIEDALHDAYVGKQMLQTGVMDTRQHAIQEVAKDLALSKRCIAPRADNVGYYTLATTLMTSFDSDNRTKPPVDFSIKCMLPKSSDDRPFTVSLIAQHLCSNWIVGQNPKDYKYTDPQDRGLPTEPSSLAVVDDMSELSSDENSVCSTLSVTALPMEVENTPLIATTANATAQQPMEESSRSQGAAKPETALGVTREPSDASMQKRRRKRLGF